MGAEAVADDVQRRQGHALADQEVEEERHPVAGQRHVLRRDQRVVEAGRQRRPVDGDEVERLPRQVLCVDAHPIRPRFIPISFPSACPSLATWPV